MKINTVHVHDVARALFHLCTHGEDGATYNLADKSNTGTSPPTDNVTSSPPLFSHFFNLSDQELVNKHLANIFGIQTDFLGSVKSNLAKTLGMDAVTSQVNDKHIAPWSKMTKEKGIEVTPISPYLDKELLGNNSLSIDGSAIEKTGFTYSVPEFTEAKLREWIDYYTALKLFPEGYVQ